MKKILEEYAVAIQTVAAIISALAILFGALQVLKGRQALDAQATAEALQSARGILVSIQENPQAYASLTGVEESKIVTAAFINAIISMFSEQYYFWRAGVLPAEHWERFRIDLCDFVKLSEVQPVVVNNIGRGSYPIEFKIELISCGVKLQ